MPEGEKEEELEVEPDGDAGVEAEVEPEGEAEVEPEEDAEVAAEEGAEVAAEEGAEVEAEEGSEGDAEVESTPEDVGESIDEGAVGSEETVEEDDADKPIFIKPDPKAIKNLFAEKSAVFAQDALGAFGLSEEQLSDFISEYGEEIGATLDDDFLSVQFDDVDSFVGAVDRAMTEWMEGQGFRVLSESEIKDQDETALPEGLEVGTGAGPEGSEEVSERDFNKNLIEASIFISSNPVSIEELSLKLDIKKKEVEELVNELAFDYMERATSLEIVQIGDRFTMQIKPEYTSKIKSFSSGGLIPEAIMRTLTIIALKQPILKSLLVKIRGSGAYEHCKYLLENGLIDQVKKGRSWEIRTTETFADTFGLPRDTASLKKTLMAQLGVKDDK
ncbi:MAG: SMC-Scp complex subunit ScpB [Promethearchaeota archaeon]